jgi:hypothetical protein
VIRTFAPLPSGICSPLSGLKLQRSFSPRFDSLVFVGLKKTKSNYLLSIARENAKEHKHNNDNDDDPKDSADRKKHSERCKHSPLQVGVSVSSLLVALRNESSHEPRVPFSRQRTEFWDDFGTQVSEAGISVRLRDRDEVLFARDHEGSVAEPRRPFFLDVEPAK